MNRVVHVNTAAKTRKNELRLLREENARLANEKRRVEEILRSTMHEAREFSNIISSKSYQLLSDEKYQEGVVSNIYYTAGMLSARLGFTDMEIDPRGMGRHVKDEIEIYKKFDKSRYLLNHLQDYAGTKIEFHGESFMSIEAIIAFEMVPFVILQNAVKYSPKGYSVDVYFNQIDKSLLEVKVSSFGPHVSEDEIDHLFENGGRGRSSYHYDGQGLGLYLAKRLCEYHNASINIELGDTLGHSLGGEMYRRFTVVMVYESFSHW